MRLKTFHAETLTAAFALVRETLGDEAIIVATAEGAETDRGARVTAAIDEPESGPGAWESAAAEEALERIADALGRHGTPRALADRIVNAASDTEEADATLALAGALDTLFAFRPLPDGPGGPPLLFAGPPGAGKTVSCAKLGARVALAHEGRSGTPPVALAAADALRVGAVDQLRGYAERLGAPFHEVPDADALAQALARIDADTLVAIDAPGVNPYDLQDLAHIIELAEAARAEPVLLVAAGRDAEEAAELTKAFRPLGPTRLLVTGLDIARRLGAVLAAADAAGLAFCDISRSPRIGDGLEPLNPLTLARLLVPSPRSDPDTAEQASAAAEPDPNAPDPTADPGPRFTDSQP